MALVLYGSELPRETEDKPPEPTLFEAIETGDEDRVRLPLDSPELTLLEAIETGDEDRVRFLLDSPKPGLGATFPAGQTALHLAVSDERGSIVSLLLDKGVDTEAAQGNGDKPLYLAAALGNLAIVEDLVNFNAKIESLNLKTRCTALHAAVGKRHIEVARFLLKNGANVDSRDLAGDTPLCVAVRGHGSEYLEIAGLLLQYGANKKILLPDSRGKAVQDLAEGDNDMKEMLNSAPLLEGPSVLDLGTRTKLLPPVFEGGANMLNACHGFEATIVDFYIDDRERRIQVSCSVFELLYGKGPKEIMSSETKGKRKQPNFRWYHLPANNMAWVKDLVARHYIDRGAGAALTEEDLQANLGLNNSAGQQYRASTAHYSFMRPLCHTIKSRSNIPRGELIKKEAEKQASASLSRIDSGNKAEHIMLFMPFLHFETMRAYESMSETISEIRSWKQKEGAKVTGTDPVPNYVTVGHNNSMFPQTEKNSTTIPVQGEISKDESSTPTSTKPQPDSRQDNVEEPEKEIFKGPDIDKKPIRFRDPMGRTFSFPYALCCTWPGMEELIRQVFLHVEFSHDRVGLHAYDLFGPNKQLILPYMWQETIEPGWTISMHWWAENLHQYLMRGYMMPLKPGDNSPLQPRRTLDQYFYTDLENTSRRDRDQVVFRYMSDKKRKMEPRIFMVDQLWLWVLDNDTVITCCPQRWDSWLTRAEVQLENPFSPFSPSPFSQSKPSPNVSLGLTSGLIKFNAVGRTFDFQFEQCKSWEGMESLVRGCFPTDDVIGRHVFDGQYDLIGPEGDIILPKVWESIIQRGWSISMHLWPLLESPKPRPLPRGPHPGPRPGPPPPSHRPPYMHEARGGPPPRPPNWPGRPEPPPGPPPPSHRPPYMHEARGGPPPRPPNWPGRPEPPPGPPPPGHRPYYMHGARGGPPPRPPNWPGGPGQPPIIVNLTAGEEESRSRSWRKKPAKAVLDWMAGKSGMTGMRGGGNDNRSVGKDKGKEKEPLGTRGSTPPPPPNSRGPRPPRSFQPGLTPDPTERGFGTPGITPKPTSSSRRRAPSKPPRNSRAKSRTEGKAAGPADQQPGRPIPFLHPKWTPLIPEDPLNVQQMILKHLTRSSRKPITTVYDLATLTTNFCADVFDQYHIPNEFQFLDFFEQSIGEVIDKEARYMREFTEGLRRLNLSPDDESEDEKPENDRSEGDRLEDDRSEDEGPEDDRSEDDRSEDKGPEDDRSEDESEDDESDEVLSITRETELLVEVKDIRDELSILKMVLKDQEQTMEELDRAIRDAGTKPGKEQFPSYKRNRILESHLIRIEKMEELTEKAYNEIRHLLELKQKQANIAEALSARKQAKKLSEHAKQGVKQSGLLVEQSSLLVQQAESARIQADETAKQGKAILVFTIITIVFLPLSFMAAFFAINIDSFSFNNDGKLPLDYVLKYMLSIAFAASVPFIVLAFNQDIIMTWLKDLVKALWSYMTQWGYIPQWLKRARTWVVLGGVASIFALTMPLIWARQLASTAKVALTLAIVLFIAAIGLLFGGWRLVIMRSRPIYSETDSGSSSGVII